MTIHDKIRALRKQKRFSQLELADAVGVSRTAVYDWERGAYSPEGNNLKNLATALDTTISYLLGETNESAQYTDILPSERTPEQWEAIRKQKMTPVFAKYDAMFWEGLYGRENSDATPVIGVLARVREFIKHDYRYLIDTDKSIISGLVLSLKELIDQDTPSTP